MVEAYSDVKSRNGRRDKSRSTKRKESRRRRDDSEDSEGDAEYGSGKKVSRKQVTKNRARGAERGILPSEDNKQGNVRVKTNGFRGGRIDSTASKVKMRRGMRVEEIDREEFLDLQNTADITDIDYDEPASKTFET